MNQEELIEGLLNIDLDMVMEDIMYIAHVLDGNYKDKPSNYYMKYTQYSHISLKSLIIADFINWLVLLGFSDGDFSIVELEFIKRYLRLDMPTEEILEFCMASVETGYLRTLPASFKLFMEDDKEMNKLAVMTGRSNKQDIASKLLFAYEVMGIHFIICDGVVDETEKAVYFGHTQRIREMMDDLNVNAMSEFYRRKLKDELGIF